jgi:ABC-type multidrug transport system fused ATPase/permease subunit
MVNKRIAQGSISIAIVFGFFGVFVYMLHQGVEKDIQLVMIGALIQAFATVVSYYLGSSSGSARKTEIAADAATSTAVAAEVAKAVATPPAAVPPAVSSQIESAVKAATSENRTPPNQ